MTVKILTQAQKTLISQHYLSKQWNQKQLARMYLVSERTINRVLNEAGLATAVPRPKGEAYQVMQILKKNGVTVETLEERLNSRVAVTPEMVQLYLNQCSKEELARFFYTSGLIKLTEIDTNLKKKKEEKVA